LHLSHILLTEGRTFIVLPFGTAVEIYLHAQPQAPFVVADASGTRRRECPLAKGHGRTLLVPVRNPAASQIVGRELDDDLVSRKDPDVVHAHLPRDVRKHLVPILELHAKHSVG
jgi:hypothetical protein